MSIPPRIEKLCTERHSILTINTEQNTLDIDEKEGEGISEFTSGFPNRYLLNFFILIVIGVHVERDVVMGVHVERDVKSLTNQYNCCHW